MKVMLILVSLVLVSCTSKLEDFRAYDEKPSAGSIQAPAEGTSCYVTVSIQENEKRVSQSSEEVLVEVEIDMRYQSNIQKNWNAIAKELGYRDIKKMIETHKNHENWDRYKKFFNKPVKFDKGKFLSKKIDPRSMDPLLISEISISLISRYFAEVIPIPPDGVSNDACIYNVQVNRTEDTLITTLTGKDLNTYGESKKTGVDGMQQSMLRALFRTLETKRKEICDDHGSVLYKECALLLAEAEIEKSECWLEISTDMENQTDVPDKKLVAEIATSLISQYLVEVMYFEKSKFEKMFGEDDSTTTEEKKEFEQKIEQILISNECLYKVYPKIKDDTILITLSGPDLNAYGSSKQPGADGLQEAMLMALFRSLKEQRNTICQDYGKILVDPCENPSADFEKQDFEKQDAKFRIRGFVHNHKESNYSLRNISYLFTMKDWGFGPSVLKNGGIGQTFLTYESKSSSGAGFKASVSSLDISKSFVIEGGPKNTLNKFRSIIMDLLPIKSTSGEWVIIPGMGVVFPPIIPKSLRQLERLIYKGQLDISSQYGDYSTEKAFGYSFFAILGMEIGEWEMLLASRWSQIEFSEIKAGAENFVLSGTNFMFGLGWGF